MNFSLKAKFLLAAAGLTLAISGYIFLIQKEAAEMGLLMRQVVSNNLLAVQTASEIKHSFVFYDDLIFRFVSTGDAALLGESERVREKALLEIGRLKTLSDSPTLRDLLKNLEKESRQYFHDAQRLVQFYHLNQFPGETSVLKAIAWAQQAAKNKQSLSLLSAEGRARLTRIYSLCESLVDIHRVQMEEAQKQVNRILRKSSRHTRWAGAAVFLGTMLIGVLLMLSILTPIRALLSGVQRIVGGDMNFEIPSPGKDEIGRLTQAFNSMTQKLREKHRQLLEQTITDALTGVHNFRHFQEVLKSELERAHRHKRNLALLLLDIDHFKKYNDTHGHEMGNVILRTVAQVLRETLRPEDTLARYGGEEFVVLLAEADRTQGEIVAERLRLAVESCQFPGQETQPGGHISISLGGACFPQDSQVAKGLIEKADKALYASKNAGRNRFLWVPAY